MKSLNNFFPILFARIKESAYLYRKYFYYSPLNVKIMASRRELKKKRKLYRRRVVHRVFNQQHVYPWNR